MLCGPASQSWKQTCLSLGFPRSRTQDKSQVQMVYWGGEPRKSQQQSGEVKQGEKTLGTSSRPLPSQATEAQFVMGDSGDGMNMPQSQYEGVGGLAHQLWSIKGESFSQETLTCKHLKPVLICKRRCLHLEALRGWSDVVKVGLDSICYNPQELPQPRLKGKCKMFTTVLTR